MLASTTIRKTDGLDFRPEEEKAGGKFGFAAEFESQRVE
jgi:hypothetical protein